MAAGLKYPGLSKTRGGSAFLVGRSRTYRKEIWTMSSDALAAFRILPPKTVAALENDLVFRFLAVFSRFECALKRAHFLKNTRHAKPDWDKYANELRGFFANVADEDFQKAVEFLRSRPPQTQVVDERGELSWEATSTAQEEHCENYVLLLVRVVRNNLFHGGKYSTGVIEDTARNEALLEASITILRHCRTLNHDVHRAFEDVA